MTGDAPAPPPVGARERFASIGALAATTGEALPAGLVIETPLPHTMYCCGL